MLWWEVPSVVGPWEHLSADSMKCGVSFGPAYQSSELFLSKWWLL